jgi:hypothetical protein
LSLVGLIRQILRTHPEGMTPQQIRETIKTSYPDFYDTESHRRNVDKGHYKDIDHALLAQIYVASHTYPIFDSFVEKMMLHYRSADHFHAFDKKDLKNYGRFIEIIKSFQRFYKLEAFSLREIDIFLWLAGKEWFPAKYKNN